MDVFLFAANAVLPIILLIALGYFLKCKGFFTKDFLKTGNAFVFRICLPCMLFSTIYAIGSFDQIQWSTVLYAVIILTLLWLLSIPIVRRWVPDHRRKGVVLQCVIRSNFALIGLPLSQALGGQAGLEVAAILSAFSIPLFNVLAVISLSMFSGTAEKHSVKHMLTDIIKNPLILSVLAGLLVLFLRGYLPVDDTGTLVFSLENQLPFLYKAIKNLSSIASPLALVVLGGQFDFRALKGMLKEIILGTVSRVVAVPVIAIGIAVLLSEFTSVLQFDLAVYPAFVALFGSPVAVSSAIMAEQMDNDGALAGQLVVWTSLFSIFTIFILVVILRSAGLL